MPGHREAQRARTRTRTAAVPTDYVEPDLTGKCGARELLGTRVCDIHEGHDPKKEPHEGAGPRDERRKFHSVRR